MLLGSSLENQTVVAVDPKGELANLAGPFFEIPFYPHKTVHILDPWDQCKTGQTSVLNVLDTITEDNPNYVDDARALADAMIIPSGGENTHWDNAARNFLTAILLYVAVSPKEKEHRDLLRVREIVALTWALPKAYTGPKRPTLSALLFELLDCELAGGAIKRGVSSLLNREDKERSGIISSIDRDTSWIDSPQMAKVLRGDSLDLTEAARGGRKYFIVLPPDFFMTHRAWLRLMVTAFAKAFKRTPGDQEAPRWMRWRHIVIDEFANLGEMSFILNDIAVSRGFGVKYHLAIQDLSQLARVYSQGWESFINNSFQRFFAISDMFTADYVSRMLGTATVRSRSQSTSTSEGTSLSRNAGDSFSQSRNSGSGLSPGGSSSGQGQNFSTGLSDNSGWSQTDTISLVQRPLMTADEIRRMEGVSQLVFVRGMHPIECWRPPYWRIFRTLPKFSLKEVWGTIGRQANDAAELRYFTDWHMTFSVMEPTSPAQLTAEAATSSPTPEIDAPASALPPKPSKALGRFAAIAAVILAALAGYWIFWRDAPVPSPPLRQSGILSPPAGLGQARQENLGKSDFPGFFAPATQTAQQPAPAQREGPIAAPDSPSKAAAATETASAPPAAGHVPKFAHVKRRVDLPPQTCVDEKGFEYRPVGFKTVCGKLISGGATLGSAQTAYSVRLVDECALYCRRTAGCAAFSYSPRGGGPLYACRLFGANSVETDATDWVTLVANQRPPQ